MGQKVNPVGIRLGITRDWTSKWYASTKNFPAFLHTDHLVRQFLKKRLVEASISRIQIERAARKVNITIHTARPGIVIGKKGEDIEKLRGQVSKMMKMPVTDVRINIAEIRKLGCSIMLVEQNAAMALEVADFGYVLDTGKVTLSGPASDLKERHDVIEAYLG